MWIKDSWDGLQIRTGQEQQVHDRGWLFPSIFYNKSTCFWLLQEFVVKENKRRLLTNDMTQITKAPLLHHWRRPRSVPPKWSWKGVFFSKARVHHPQMEQNTQQTPSFTHPQDFMPFRITAWLARCPISVISDKGRRKGNIFHICSTATSWSSLTSLHKWFSLAGMFVLNYFWYVQNCLKFIGVKKKDKKKVEF